MKNNDVSVLKRERRLSGLVSKRTFIQFSHVLALIFSVLLSSCEEEQTNTQKPGQMIFLLSLQEQEQGRMEEGQMSMILLSVRKSNGQVLNNIKLSVFSFGGKFVSEPLQLEKGSYQLTQFAVVSDNHTVIFATPVTGSPQAELVDKPLPLSFSVDESKDTELMLQVIKISTASDPEDFGFISFEFETIDITAFEIPMTDISMNKIRYEIQNGDELISAEIDGAASILNLKNPGLIGKTCPVRIEVWTQDSCRQKVFIYQKVITFDGSLIKLTPLAQWEAFYFVNVGNGYTLFFPADPISAFRFELHTEYPTGYGFINRGLWDEDGEPVCGGLIMEEIIVNSRVTSISLADAQCQDPALFQVDSYVFLGQYPEKLLEFHLIWDNKNGVFIPQLCN